MLRHIYFFTLLLYINITFSFEYLVDQGSNYQPVRKNHKIKTHSKRTGEKFNEKRQDYEMVYDNNPVAQIDVASFIQSPDDTVDSNQPYEEPERRNQFYYRDYKSLIDSKEESPMEVRDHQNLIANQLPEIDIFSKIKHIVPQNMDLNALSGGNYNEIIDPHKIMDKKKISDQLSFDNGHNPAKKCALKNMKIPFFSRNKDTKTKEKKQKKRRLFGFGKMKKQTQSVSKSETYNLKTNDFKRGYTESSHIYNKLKKRSYFEKLCPACRKKVVKNDMTNLKINRRTPNGIIHNSRQYYQANYNKQNINRMKKPSAIMKYTNTN